MELIGEDMPAKLALFIDEKRKVPFQWGQNDCCTFTCDWIAIRKGVDPAAELRGKYQSALGAARILKARGGVEQIADDFCRSKNYEKVAPAMARRGDVVCFETDRGPALGVCCGERSAFPGGDGIQLVDTLKCECAWRIS